VNELAALFEVIQRQFPSGRLDRANFGKVFAAGDDAFAQRLWEALDPRGSGFIDFREYALGASIFCVGTKQEKLKCTIHAFSAAIITRTCRWGRGLTGSASKSCSLCATRTGMGSSP
jgi:hypothetical protein